MRIGSYLASKAFKYALQTTKQTLLYVVKSVRFGHTLLLPDVAQRLYRIKYVLAE
jgi:hypothetical protein